jgi:hypothetical protein
MASIPPSYYHASAAIRIAEFWKKEDSSFGLMLVYLSGRVSGGKVRSPLDGSNYTTGGVFRTIRDRNVLVQTFMDRLIRDLLTAT